LLRFSASDEARSITAAAAADGLYEQLSNVFVEVIRMEFAVAAVNEIEVASRRGRFSLGVEQLVDPSPHVGTCRFSEGVEQLTQSAASTRVGRFCTGVERSPDSPSALRVGSFADGSEQIPRR
jgi:hypothetical protein